MQVTIPIVVEGVPTGLRPMPSAKPSLSTPPSPTTPFSWIVPRPTAYIYTESNACVCTYDIYTIHSCIRGPIQVHLGGGRSRATTRICNLLILLGWVSARCAVILCWCLRRDEVVVYVLFGEDLFILSKEFWELNCKVCWVLDGGFHDIIVVLNC